jgi:hypothetical protein
MVEWDPRTMVVQDMIFNSAVKDMTADESKVAINSRGGTPEKGPTFGAIIR